MDKTGSKEAQEPKNSSGRVVGLGGTFNSIHKGHEVLLRKAFQMGDLVLIGLTTDLFATSTREDSVEIAPFEERLLALHHVLAGPEFRGAKYKIFPLEEPYGPAATMREFHVLVVSPETLALGRKINLLRKEKGLEPFEIVQIPYVLAMDKKPISATRVLRKEIDRNGNLNYLFPEKGLREGRYSLAALQDTARGKTPLLVHTCCASCLLALVRSLKETKETTETFWLLTHWFNPNIHPSREYMKRREAFLEFCSKEQIPVVLEEDYPVWDFFVETAKAEALEQETGQDPEEGHLRCQECYLIRLGRSAEMAGLLGIPHYTSTLLASPYQDHELLRSLGEELGRDADTRFFYKDFSEDHRQVLKDYKQTGLYRQNYCGCLFSERERFLKSDQKP